MAGQKHFLNRDMIKQVMEEFKDSTTVEVFEFAGPPKMKKFKVTVPGDEVASTISCYYTVDGHVSLTLQECQNKVLGQQLIDYVIKETSFDPKNNGSIYINPFPMEHLDDLINYVVSEFDAKELQTFNRPNGITKVIESRFGDKCYLNFFTKTNSFNVQGKSGLMKSQILEALTIYLPYHDLVESTLETYKVTNVTKTEAEQLFDARLPYSTAYLNNFVKIVLMPAILLQKIEVSTTDYSFITFPAFRGLEGFMKQMFYEDGINVSNFGDVFEPDTVTGKHILKQSAKNSVTCIYKQAALEKCYNHFKNTRHLIFHVDGALIATTVIQDIEVAKSNIDDVFDLIEKSVQCFTEKNLTLLP